MHNPATLVTAGAYPLGGCGGMLPQKIQFRPSEIASDAFILVLIMHLGVIDVEGIVDT